jgi:hypothetical protein
MKEKIKPMAIGAGIGAAGLAGVAFLMKKPTKGMLMFAGIGLAVGAVVGYLISSKSEEKSNVAGYTKVCEAEDTKGKCTKWRNVKSPSIVKE